MRIGKTTLLISSALALAGCGRAELGGPAAGSEILVDLLGEEGAQFSSALTSDEEGTREEVGADTWASWSSGEKFSWLGNFDLGGSMIREDRLYLIQARHGRDVDADGDGEFDEYPSDILGRWHAIVEGQSLRSGDAEVNLLTESVFQFFRDDLDELGEEGVRLGLDAFAAQLVGDINGDGQVDYDDVLDWRNDLDRESFRGNPQALDELAAAIRGGDESEIRAAAAAIWDSLGIDPQALRQQLAELSPDEDRDGEGASSFFERLLEFFRSRVEGGQGEEVAQESEQAAAG